MANGQKIVINSCEVLTTIGDTLGKFWLNRCQGNGCVHPKTNKMTADIGDVYDYPKANWYACLTETGLFSLEVIRDLYGLDSINVKYVEHLKGLIQKHGNDIAAFRNPIGLPDIKKFKDQDNFL